MLTRFSSDMRASSKSIQSFIGDCLESCNEYVYQETHYIVCLQHRAETMVVPNELVEHAEGRRRRQTIKNLSCRRRKCF